MPSRTLGASAVLALTVALAAPVASATPGDRDARPGHGDPAWVAAHTTATRTVEPGVELLSLAWGAAAPDDRWTVLVYLPTDPAGAPSTGSMALGPKTTADRVAESLRGAGFAPFVGRVETPAYADVPAQELGWTVKVGSFATSAEASTELSRLRAAGFAGGTRYTAQDGDDAGAPQQAFVLRVDFDEFDGSLVSGHGDTLNGTERLTDQIAESGAVAGINAQWFYSSAPAGLYVKDGRLIGTPTQGRGGVVLRDGGRELDVDSFSGHVWLTVGDGSEDAETVEIDGVNRVPGRIANCGGVGGDQPTEAPQHDLTCTDESELVRFTPEWGTVPSGAGAEAVLDARGRVLAVNPARGAAVPDGGSTVQAIGDRADWLLEHLEVGQKVAVREEVRDSRGRRVPLTKDTTILQVGPTLVDDGSVEINARADGLFREGVDPTFTYNWVLRSNPRSAIGMDDQGRLLLSVVDGRQATYSEGLGILDHAFLLQRLGAVEALNLDGGGSSTLATTDGIVNRPSDATGQRSLGNALLLMP